MGALIEKVTSDEGVTNAIAFFTKTAIWGAIILGGFLLLEKIIGFGFEFSMHLGL